MKLNCTAALLVAAAMALSGCTTGSVVKSGPNTYSVTSTGAGFSTDGVRSNVYQKAEEYCSKQNLVMIEVSIDTQAGAYGRHPPNADLKFRCLEDGDPEIARRAAGVEGLMVGELRDGGNKPSEGNKYRELKQLKELLDSEAITPEEYAEQKAIVLGK